jgi:pantothenate kinase
MSIQECCEIAYNKGNARKVDLLVEDIYGKNVPNFGLRGEIIASSLGKYGKMS